MVAKSKSVWAEHGWGIAATIISSVILVVGGYIAVQTRNNEFALQRLQEKHEEVAQSVEAIKKSIVKLSLSNDPKRAEIIGGLVVDKPTAKGISLYQQGQVQLAIGTWEDAKQRGSRDADIALQAAGVGPDLDRIEIVGSRIREVPWWEELKFWRRDGEKDDGNN